MKSLLPLLLIFSLNAYAEVSLSDCLADAQLQSSQTTTPVHPLPECVDIVRNDPSTVQVTSADNRWKAFGTGHMVYVETLNAQGAVIETNLLSGEFSELGTVKKIFIDVPQKKLLVLQEKNNLHELNVQDLEFIGNTAPLKLMRHTSFNGVTAMRYLNPEQIEFTNAAGTFNLNADGESRSNISWKEALTITPK